MRIQMIHRGGPLAVARPVPICTNKLILSTPYAEAAL